MLKQCLSLSWGPSFTEINSPLGGALFHSSQLTPLQALKNAKVQNPELNRVRISMSVTRRILGTRLGHSVAQITTEGFEQWVELRQKAESGRFDLLPKRRDPLANPENIHALAERVSASGEVLKKVSMEALEKIANDLKSKQIERVCLQLLNAQANPENQILCKKFLQEKGFRVFSHAREATSRDELSAWRRNLLDASLASFFEKAHKDFLEGLLPEAPSLEYFDTEKEFSSADEISYAGLLFGREKLLQASTPVLYFGPEEWAWILPDSASHWQSPWGDVELKHPLVGFFTSQPGQELILNSRGRVLWGEDLGMDPGPILWGRSSKLLLLDILDWALETRPPLRRNEKTEEQFQSLKRNSEYWKTLSKESIQKEVFETVLHSIVDELATKTNSDEFILAGVFAEHFIKPLQKLRPKWKFQLKKSALCETENFWRP